MMLRHRCLQIVLVLLTLAPSLAVFVPVQQRQPELRLAANINQLAEDYSGFAYSDKDQNFQDVPIDLEVDTRNRNRFSALLSVNTPDGLLQIPFNGTVSSSGRITIPARLSTKDGRISVILTGQLSATGRSIIGNYSVTGRDDEGRFSDRGRFSLLRDPT